MAAGNVRDTILAYKDKKPNATPDEIAAYIRKRVPGSRTSASSVVCTLSRAGKASGGSMFAPAAPSPAETHELPETDETETDEDALERISLRYEALERMADKLVKGLIPSLIVSGPPGMSKSFTVTNALVNSGRTRHDGLENVGGGGPKTIARDGYDHPGYYDHIGGGCTAVGLYHALWNMRKGGVIFIDDCDGVFRDEEALNLLKVATDSTKERLVSWRKNAAWLDEYEIEKTFDFQGHIVFLTNIDFEQAIQKGTRDTEHFKALIDRALYLCLTLRTQRDFMIQIRKVADGASGMLMKHFGLDVKQTKELLNFVDVNKNRFYNLSLRLIGQMAICMKADPSMWKKDIEATKMRTQ